MLPIESISIENFKSFGPMQRLSLSRINFLFGPNSQGKSSSLVALGVLQHAFLNRKFNLESLDYVDNSNPILFDDNLLNTSADKAFFTISCELKLPIIDKNESFELSFGVKNLNVNELEQFEVYHLKDDDRKLVLHIGHDEIKANFSDNLFSIIGPLDYQDEDRIDFNKDRIARYFDEAKNTDEVTPLKHVSKSDGLYCSGDMQSIDTNNQLPNERGYFNAPVDQKSAELAKVINKVIDELFKILSKKFSFHSLSFIGPNRYVTNETFIKDDEISYIRPDLLNSRAVELMNTWLRTNDSMDLGYEFVLKDLPVQDKLSSRKLSIKEFGVRRSGENELLCLGDVGSGLGHIFQILLCMFNDRKIVTIQQPELHLHPSLQAQLAKSIIQLSMLNGVQLFIETHSEHFIKAAQLEIARGLNNKPKITAEYLTSDLPDIAEKSSIFTDEDLAVFYISKNGKGFSTVKRMKVDETGSFTEPWPDDFFELSADLSLERLRNSIKSRN